MVTSVVKDVKLCNRILQKAWETRTSNGLLFKRLVGPLKLFNINDASHVSGSSLYAQEGKMVILVEGKHNPRCLDEWLDETTIRKFESHAHPLYVTARRATRVSHSTSHGEALAMLGGVQVAQFIANRYSEPFYKSFLNVSPPTPLSCLKAQHLHQVIMPIDVFTDCVDVWELLPNCRGLSNGKTQRLAILGLRGYRTVGIIRGLFHTPTSAMLADALTKVGNVPEMGRCCTTGLLKFGNLDAKYFRLRVDRTRIVTTDAEAPALCEILLL